MLVPGAVTAGQARALDLAAAWRSGRRRKRRHAGRRRWRERYRRREHGRRLGIDRRVREQQRVRMPGRLRKPTWRARDVPVAGGPVQRRWAIAPKSLESSSVERY